MNRFHFIIIAIFLILPVSAFSQDKNISSPQTIDAINENESKAKVSESLKELANLLMQGANEKYNDCLNSFGNDEFCECIKLKTPSGISFLEYIEIVTLSKKEIENYSKNEEAKILIQNTIEARENCANEN